MDAMKKRYSIGEISQLSDVSVKALRFYDEKGLVKPEERDPDTGYRYYSKKQLLQLLIIKELKPLGFSLDEIKNILNQKDLYLYRQQLTKKRKSIMDEIKNLEIQLVITNKVSQSVLAGINILHAYEDLQNNEAGKPYVIETETIPKVFVIYTRYLCKYNVVDPFIERHAELLRIRDQFNLRADGYLMAIFHDHFTTQFFSNECDLEVLLPIVQENNNCPNTKQFGGFFAATTVHIGGYADLLPAYFALAEWIDDQGFVVCAPPIEQYIVGPLDMVSEDNYVTKVMWPIKKQN